MKMIAAGAAFAICAVGGWMAVQGGFTLGGATAPAFNYETASFEDRTKWLQVQAAPVKTMLNRSLPNGPAPTDLKMRVKDVQVDARRRAIEAVIKIRGQYKLDARAVPAAKKALTQQICPSYAKSELGKNKVQLLHTFVGTSGREELTLVISPIVCRSFM